MTDLMADVRTKVSAYLERTGMPEEEFGKRVLRRPEFMEQFAGQRTMTLMTADRLLRFMGEAPIGPDFKREVEAFLEVTGMRGRKLGADALGDPSFVEKLREGWSARLTTVERVRAWMVDTATPSERAVIASMLGDGGRTTFVDAASTAMWDESRRAGTSSVSVAGQAAGTLPPEHRHQVFLTTAEAAQLLRLAARKLERFRAAGEGPAYCRMGKRIYYARADLLTWAWAQRVDPHGVVDELLYERHTAKRRRRREDRRRCSVSIAR